MSNSHAAERCTPDVSVVIPTLGGESIRETIHEINNGTVIPAEILVCIPADEAHRVEGLSAPNVRILRTDCRGQVAQRARGFRAARSPLVLQLDDDILLERHCLERLVEFILAAPGTAVAPALYDRTSGEYRSYLVPNGKLTLFDRLFYWVANGRAGFQPGNIGLAGANMGVPQSGDWRDLAWLPGGCVLHERARLVLSDFYTFGGKAFAEDLFHSTLLTGSGVALARCGAATCRVDFASSLSPDMIRYAREYVEYWKRMKVFVRQIGGSTIRLDLFLVLNVIRLVARKVR